MRHDSFGRERLLVGERRPQRAVRRHDAVGDRDRVDAALEASAGFEVHDLARDVRARDVEVVRALTGGEPALVQLAGLGIHEVRGEGAGVAAEERVRQRHVAPEEADVVQAHEQHRERVDEAIRRVGAQHLGEQRAVGQRELQVRGDQGRREAASPAASVRPAITATRSTHGASRRARLPSMSYSRRAISSVVSLIATTRPERFAKRTRWRERPFGRKTIVLLGHSASGVDHGRDEQPRVDGARGDAQCVGHLAPRERLREEKTAARGVDDPPRRGRGY